MDATRANEPYAQTTMRHEPNLRIEPYRMREPRSDYGANCGAFRFGKLRIISSGTPQAGAPWEHVSVSLEDRCPTWGEMVQVKRMFWRDDETVIQFHPSADNYVNVHPYCLHLWKRVGTEMELPPRTLIA